MEYACRYGYRAVSGDGDDVLATQGGGGAGTGGGTITLGQSGLTVSISR